MRSSLKYIAIVSPWFPPASGGVSRHIFELSKAFSKIGLKVLVLTPLINNKSERILDKTLKEKFGIEVIRLNIPNYFKEIIFSYKIYKKLKRLIGKGLIDAVHFSNESGLIFYMNRISLPSVTKIHGSWPYLSYRDYKNFVGREDYLTSKVFLTTLYIYANSIHRITYMIAPALIVIRREVKLILERRFHIPSHKITVIPNGVNHEEFNIKLNEDRDAYLGRLCKELDMNLDSSKKIVLYVGDFSVLKGFHLLPLIIKKVLEKYKNVIFLIVGAYSEKNYYKGVKLLQKYGVLCPRNVKVLKFVPFEKMPMIYAVADVVILPYVDEITNVHREAMAMGKPVVSFKLQDIPDTMHKRIALFASRYNINEFANYVVELLRDDDLVKHIGINAARYSRIWNWRNVARATLEILEKQLR
mgnify:CR=1 FL=1